MRSRRSSGRSTGCGSRLYLDIVVSGLPFIPHGPIYHAQAKLNKSLRSFSIEALDVTDVVVAKLKRFNLNDAGDVRVV